MSEKVLTDQDFFLQRMGIDADDILLGDDVYMQTIIIDEIHQYTQGEYLDNTISSDKQQLTQLFRDTADQFEAWETAYAILGMTDDMPVIGQELTQAQIDSLTSDIVWFIEEERDGITVLVPKLYLANTTKTRLANNYKHGSVIKAGGDIDLVAGNIVNDSSVITAGNDLTIESTNGDIVNTGMGSVLVADRMTTLLATGNNSNIINQGGSISGNDITLNATNDIVNETLVHTTTQGENIYSNANAMASILASGTLNLVAGNDIDIKGANVTANDGLNINAGNDINIGTVALHNKSVFRDGKDFHEITESTTNVGSNIVLNNGTLTLVSGNDTNIKGSDITSTNGDIVLNTTGNLNIASVQDEYSYDYYHKKESDYGSSKTTQINEERIANRGSSLNASANIIATSDKNINIIASDINTDANLTLQADESINMLSATDMDYKRTEINKSGVGGLSSSDIVTETRNIKNIMTNANAGTDYSSVSGLDTTLVASNVSAGGNATIVAGKYIDENGVLQTNTDAQVNVLNAMDSNYSYFSKETERVDAGAVAISMYAGAMTGGYAGGVMGAYNGSQAKRGSIDIIEDYDETAIASNISGSNVSIQSANDMTLISSNVVADNNAELLAGKLRETSVSNINGMNLIQTNNNNASGIENTSNDAELLIGTATENDYHYEKHEKLRPDYVALATTSALAGAVGSGVGMIAGPVVGAGATYGVGSATQDANQKKNISETRTQTTRQAESNVVAINNDLNAISAGSLTISASNIETSNDATLQSDNGEVNILAGKETTHTEEYRERQEFDNLTAGVNRGRVYAGVEGEASKTTTTNTSTTNKSTTITTGNNLTIVANDDITSQAGNINADNNITLQSNAGDINLVSAENTNKNTEVYEDIKLKLTAGVGNAYVDAGYAVDDTVKAVEAVKDAEKELDRMKELEREGKATSEAVEDAKDNVKMAQEYLAFTIFKIGENGAKIGSSAGTGFYADVQLDTSTTKTESTSESIEHINTNIVAGNNFSSNSANDTTISGANVLANNDIDITVGNNLLVESKQNTYNSKSETERYSGGISYGTGGTGLGASFGLGKDESTTERKWVDNQTSVIGNNSVTINTNNNTHLKGSLVANATTTINEDGTEELVDGGNLTINTGSLTYEDIEDTYKEESKSYDVGIGINPSNGIPGSATLSLADKGSEKEGVTRATIGSGVITTVDNSDISELNRDVNNTQETTRDVITGALDGEMALTQSMFTKQGWLDVLRAPGVYTDAYLKPLNPVRIKYYGDRAFGEEEIFKGVEDENKLFMKEKSHERSAEAYGAYGGVVGAAIRVPGEAGQFIWYTSDDVARRVLSGGKAKGKYQPYLWSNENGGLIDSWGDITNVYNGSQGDYNNHPNQEAVDRYNSDAYRWNNGWKPSEETYRDYKQNKNK